MSVTHLPADAAPALLPTTLDEDAVDDKTFGRIATVALIGNLLFAAGVLIAYALRAAF